jgi:16S rRNA (guanine966-N2)-methyltransferase
VDPLGHPALDLYAGAGGLGLEALSRGAPRCDFVDSSAAACATLRRNLAALELGDRGRVTQAMVESFLKRAREGYGLVLADPPYADAGAPLRRVLVLLVERALLRPDALVVVEHGDHETPTADGPVEGLRLLDERRYGQTVTSFFAPEARGRQGD